MAIERTINLVREGIYAAGLRIAVRELRDNSPFRNRVLEQVRRIIGYDGDAEGFLYQIPGNPKNAETAAMLFSQTGFNWKGNHVFRRTLAHGINPENNDEALYVEVRPADFNQFDGLYIVREHGTPMRTVREEGRLVTDLTQKYFLAGRRFIPEGLRIPEDTSRYPGEPI